MKVYTTEQETWGEGECRKRSRSNPANAFGDREPWPGKIAGSSSPHPEYGRTIRYNGGTIIDGELYDAVRVPLPEIHEAYEFVDRPTWGTYIQRKGTK